MPTLIQSQIISTLFVIGIYLASAFITVPAEILEKNILAPTMILESSAIILAFLIGWNVRKYPNFAQTAALVVCMHYVSVLGLSKEFGADPVVGLLMWFGGAFFIAIFDFAEMKRAPSNIVFATAVLLLLQSIMVFGIFYFLIPKLLIN